jgi:pilus assembly protein CpaF
MNVEVIVDSLSGGAMQVQHLGHLDVLSIGRESGCTIRLPPGEYVSRTHARVRVTSRGLHVEDLSTNGTLAGGQLLRRDSAEVPDGTPLLVDQHRIVIRPQRDRRVEPTDPGEASSARSATPPPSSRPRARAAGSDTRGSDARGADTRGSDTRGNDARSGTPAASVHDTSEAELRREIHRLLIDHLDLVSKRRERLDDPSFRPKVLTALRRIVSSLADRLPSGLDENRLIGEMADEVLGLGPLEQLLADDSVTEIMVVNPHTVYVERAGRLELSPARFTDEERVRAVIERILAPLGRRIDEWSPLVVARLPDGSRVNAVIRPLSPRAACLTIRKFSRKHLRLEDLQASGSLDERMERLLRRSVVARKNIIISGGTGSGKTTLLNALSGAIPAGERIVTIEDAAELRLLQPHVVSLEARPPNLEGRGAYTIRDLLKNALRMRPDRILIGECRGGEALDMLQAMNTGHDGSLTTTHANSPEEAVRRIETLALMSGVELPARAIREQLAASVHLIVQQSRLSDGSRRVTSIAEVGGLDPHGDVVLRPIFEFRRTGTGPEGKVLGRYAASGYLPSFLDEFVKLGLIAPGVGYL